MGRIIQHPVLQRKPYLPLFLPAPAIIRRRSARERDRRDERDGANEMGTQSVHVALFSHAPRITRHGAWCWRTSSASCQSSELRGMLDVMARLDRDGQA